MRYKYVIKFKNDEIPIIYKALELYQENTAADPDGGKQFFKISAMMRNCIVDEEVRLQATIKALENKGYKVIKAEFK